jgi:hypothetical protein
MSAEQPEADNTVAAAECSHCRLRPSERASRALRWVAQKHRHQHGTTPLRIDRRRHAKPPATGGRRGDAVIPQIPGLPEWMAEQFREVPRPSFREIEDRLKTTEFWPKIRAAGFRTGKSTVHRYYVSWFAEMAQKRVIAEEAATYNESGTAGDVLDIEAAISGLANVAIYHDLQQELREGKGVSPKAGALIDLHRKLQTSSARREAERRAAGVSARKAYEAAREEIVTILKDNPDALRLVLAAIDNAQNKTEETKAA